MLECVCLWNVVVTRRRHDRTLIICLQSELLTFISYLLARAAGFLP
eukprot:COSAG03_NODE_1367_length_4246_cov_6.674705_1_plen_45_part_10